MKIIQVCHRIYPSYIGGVEKAVWEISKHLSERLEIEIYATNPRRKEPFTFETRNIRISEFPSIAPNNIFYFSPSLYVALKRAKADVIHAHGCQQFPSFVSAFAKKKNGLPLVVTPHLGFSEVPEHFFKLYDFIANRLVFEKADRIVTVSSSEVNHIRKLGNFDEKTLCIPNGVDVERIDSVLSVCNRSAYPKVFLYVGRLEKKKGLSFLVQAFSKASKNALLTIVGDGPFKDELKELVSKLKISDKVRILGRVSDSDLNQLYATSHVFLLLSSYESHSIALTEAMAFGLVPVVTNVGGNQYLVSNHENGFLVRYPVCVDEVCNVMCRLIQEQNLIDVMSRKARQTVKGRFDIKLTTKRLEQVYESLASK